MRCWHPIPLGLFAFSGINGALINARGEASNLGIIESDIAIIGGGSSGTYSAIRLTELGKTVTLIERNSRLGGHVNTYVDRTTGKTFDYGVISFLNISVVTNYFASFNIPLGPLNYGSSNTTYDFANFKSGEYVSDTSLPSGNSTAALLAYAALLNEKYPYLSNGYDLPAEIPEDFLITWGEFIQKYQLGDLAYTTYQYLQGVGNILAQPALYILKYLSVPTALNIINPGNFLTTARNDNQELYDKALAKLGSKALISSNVTSVQRTPNGVELNVSTPSGPKIIKASKLLIAIQPKLESLSFLDLDVEEKALFGQFNNSYYWDAVLTNTGIPVNKDITNININAPYDIPPFPGLYFVDSADIPGLFTTYYTSPGPLTDDEVKADITSTIARLVKAGNFSTGTNGEETEFLGFNSHAPFELTVSTDAIKGGFYKKLLGLQGERNTWWTGATWQAHDSSLIWNWTETNIVPALAK